jgi:hypothetical protein
MRLPVLISAVVVLLTWTTPTWAQTNDLRTLGSALTGPPLVITGDLVMESVGLHEVIRDLSDPLESALVGWLDHSLSGFYGPRYHDQGLVLALQARQPWGFEILRVDDPSAPEVIHSTGGIPYRSGWLQDRLLAVATSSYAVFYDLQDPAAPAFAALRMLGDHQSDRWFAELDGVLYGIDRGANFRGFDLSQPSDPVDLGTATVPGLSIEAMVAGPGALHVLVSSQQAGGTVDLLTLRPVGPMAFEATSTLSLSTTPFAGPYQLAWDGALLLAAPGDDTLHAFDLSDPFQPDAGFVLPVRANHLAIGQQQFYVLGNDTLHTFGRAPVEQTPQLTSSRPVIPAYRTVLGHGPVVLAQLADVPSRIVPVDISNPGLLDAGEAVDLGFGETLSFGNDLLVAVDGSERFDVWDVADPHQPVRLNSTRVPDVLHGRALIDGPRVAFFNNANLGIALYDISAPTAPVVGAGIRSPFPRAYRDGLLLSGLGSPLQLFDARDVQRPKLASRIQLNGSPLAATLARNLAIVSVERLPGEVTLHVFGLADPTDPVELGSVPLPGRATALIPHGNRIYAQGFSTTWVVDISLPRQPMVEGQFTTWGEAGRGLAFDDDVTVNSGWLISLRDDGFVITDAPSPVPTLPRLQPAYPNPFNPSTSLRFSVPRTMHLTLTVHDVRGRTVATLLDEVVAAGEHTRQWQGADQQGRPVASGLYLVRLSGQGVEAHQAVTLIK